MQKRRKRNSDSIRDRLKAAREARGMSARALSMAMDPSPGLGWASFVENGSIGSPSISALLSAAKVLNVSFNWLATGVGEMEAA